MSQRLQEELPGYSLLTSAREKLFSHCTPAGVLHVQRNSFTLTSPGAEPGDEAGCASVISRTTVHGGLLAADSDRVIAAKGGWRGGRIKTRVEDGG